MFRSLDGVCASRTSRRVHIALCVSKLIPGCFMMEFGHSSRQAYQRIPHYRRVMSAPFCRRLANVFYQRIVRCLQQLVENVSWPRDGFCVIKRYSSHLPAVITHNRLSVERSYRGNPRELGAKSRQFEANSPGACKNLTHVSSHERRPNNSAARLGL